MRGAREPRGPVAEPLAMPTQSELNKLKVLSCDIGNAYLNAPCKEKIWFVAGPECGRHRGKVCKLKRALYGLKSSGASWREMFANFIKKS